MERNNKEDENGIDTRKNNDNVVCVAKHDDKVGEQMERETHLRHTRLMQGCTSLMYACQHGYVDIVVEELRTKVLYEFSLYFV